MTLDSYTPTNVQNKCLFKSSNCIMLLKLAYDEAKSSYSLTVEAKNALTVFE